MMKLLRILTAILIVCVNFTNFIWAQDPAPRLKKVQIEKTGCSLYAPDTLQFDLSFSEDSSAVYTGEWLVGNHRFAVILVDLNNVILANQEEKEDLLISCLDFLQANFEITESAGYGKGHMLESDPTAVGVIDYWIDASADEWAIKGWINDRYIAVLMLYGPGEYPHYTV